MYGHVIHFFSFFCLVKLFLSSCLFVFLPLWWIKMNIDASLPNYRLIGFYKKTCPINLSDYRPISVTPIVSRLAETTVMTCTPDRPNYWPVCLRPTGSTTSALNRFIQTRHSDVGGKFYCWQHSCRFLQSFWCCTLLCSLIKKIPRLNIPSSIRNWIVNFLTGRSRVCRITGGALSNFVPITSSIVQGSGIVPTLWIIMESDPHPQ